VFDQFRFICVTRLTLDKFAAPVAKNTEPMMYGLPVNAIDQFGAWQVTPLEPCWLCLPMLKLYTVPNEESTWGKIKSLYSE
jgi:hypothetical protein